MTVLKVIFSLVGFFSTTAYAGTFSMATYLEKCGGKIYAKCDSKELNQITIFKAAQTQAKEERKQLMVIFGADWCPACISFARMVENDSEKTKLFEKFVMVEINGDVASGKALADILRVSAAGYPQAFIFKTDTAEMVQQFYPTQFTTINALLEIIGKTVSVSEDAKPKSLGEIQTATIEKPIELHNDYGTSPFIKEAKTTTEKYINQGVAALHVYHYVDAYRAFKEAERNDPKLVMSYVGQVLAVMQIGFSNERSYFAQLAINKIEARAKDLALPEIEKAWYEFAKSFYAATATSYTPVPGKEVKSLSGAYAALVAEDSANLDGISLVTWLNRGAIGVEECNKIYNAIVKALPNNIGAHHALLHLAEMQDDNKTAQEHAKILKDLAPGSAHAQHMYGHTLPQQGKWAEALEYFKKADAIHQAWAKKNGFTLNQDWHYAHNLDLMAGAYLGLGDAMNAAETWRKGADSDGRAIQHMLGLVVAMAKFEDANAYLQVYEQVPVWKEYLRPMRQELELTTENASAFAAANASRAANSENTYDKLIQALVKSYVDKTGRNDALSKQVTTYFADRFKSGGFDGWSSGYIEMLRLGRVAKKLSIGWLLADLEPLEFAVRSGSLCSQSSGAKSMVPCMIP